MEYIYIVNKYGKPLMPTTRQSHIRRLLKSGKAVVINNKPFTVKLKYDVEENIQPITLGIDTGRENIGLSCIANNKCLIRINFTTNNKTVTKNMSERREFRSDRRHHKRIRKQRRSIQSNNIFQDGNDNILRSKKECKSKDISYPGMEEHITCKVIKGKEAKFNNRKRINGWLTPSARQLVQMHVNAIKLISTFLPISNISIERVCFDFQKLENENIRNWQYSKGILYGFKDYKDYINQLQFSKCLMCDNKINHYHHIVQRSKNGSNTPKNIVGLCNNCHDLVHKDLSYTDELLSLKSGIYKKHEVSLLNSCMDVIIDELNKLYPVKVTTGYETYVKRNALNLEKDHCIDAICIAIEDTDNFNLNLPNIFNLRRFKKNSNNIISKRGQREYYYNNQLVAVNRHKATAQTSNSLEEYMSNYAITHTKYECDNHFHELTIKPAKRIYTYHKNKIVSPFKVGDKVKYEKHNKIKGNAKTGVFIVDGLKISENKIIHNKTKNKLMKYCKLVNHNSLQFV